MDLYITGKGVYELNDQRQQWLFQFKKYGGKFWWYHSSGYCFNQ